MVQCLARLDKNPKSLLEFTLGQWAHNPSSSSSFFGLVEYWEKLGKMSQWSFPELKAVIHQSPIRRRRVPSPRAEIEYVSTFTFYLAKRG
ncbi:hypothetical protein E2C01_093977 [Portunus trituberculatus]|uniref:Uncharacterized protein n=1 Tax=Portunus trituberculatus TaxID=210409 RepID=A0A5B7JVZ8_PORTR|nr:hypothetical protein [Portunus trituberculatus]